MNSLKSFADLFYPDICICCWERQAVKNGHFCVSCLTELPFTSHFTIRENTVTKKFWGRIDVVAGASLFYYGKGSMIREMIHKMKYNNLPFVAKELGILAGRKIKESGFYDDVTHLIPVPMHYRKKTKRGYNQSEIFARAISSIVAIPTVTDLLVKYKETTTQTDKGRISRYENVVNSFKVKGADKYRGSHFLLVDDVITTGATLEACAERLSIIPDVRFSVITMAMARN